MAITRVRLPELAVPGLPLGRHVCHDDRSRDFPAEPASGIISVTHAAVGLPLNQGSIGSCTANAMCGALNSLPDKLADDPVRTEPAARELYGLETKMEGQPWPPHDPGGSGLEVSKAAKKLGWLTSYKHAFGVQHALEALVLRPVIIGIEWLSSFDTPDPTGLITIQPGATIRGGHELVLDQIDAEAQTVTGWNSWGPTWGAGGRFSMSFDTFEQMLARQGDCVAPIR